MINDMIFVTVYKFSTDYFKFEFISRKITKGKNSVEFQGWPGRRGGDAPKKDLGFYVSDG